MLSDLSFSLVHEPKGRLFGAAQHYFLARSESIIAGNAAQRVTRHDIASAGVNDAY